MATASPIPVGLNLTTMGVSADWWLESAARAEAAGFRTIWAWDHYMTFAVKDRPTTPVLECWTLLAAVAARTKTLRVGSFVANAVNHHPAVLARHAMTVAAIAGSGDRLELGMGIGGHPAGAPRLRDRVPGAQGARRAIGGAAGGRAWAARRRPVRLPRRALHARRGVCAPGAGAAAAADHRRGETGRGTHRGAARGRHVHVRGRMGRRVSGVPRGTGRRRPAAAPT